MGIWALFLWVLGVLLALAIIFLILYSAYIQYQHMKYDHIPGPPRDSFFFGHSQVLAKLGKKSELVHDLFLEWIQQYGPVIRLHFLHKVLIIAASPEAVKEYLMSSKYQKDWYYDTLFAVFGIRFMGRGLVVDRDYDHWHKQRRMMDPAFSRTYLMGLMAPFNERAEDLMEVLQEKADGKTQVVMHEMLSRTALDVILKVAFGLELNVIRDDQTPFPRAISLVMRALVESRTPFIRINPKKWGYVKDVQESIKLIRKMGKECIEKRGKEIQEGHDVPKDILTQTLKMAAQEGECDIEELVDNFFTFFIAGHETTANKMSFTVLELARNPEILKKAQAEVDEVIGSKRDLDYDDLGKLQYLSQVLKESLRLYPVAPGTTRALVEEAVIEGVRIPPSVSIMFSSYIMGRMEKFFPDPLVFNPDRFHPDAPKPYYCYFPFALGPRSCIGQVFAQMEAKVVLAKLLQRFEFELVEGQSLKIYDTGTLRPMDGTICRLRPRSTPGNKYK